jgi:alkylation response protein AidB-like acyl-CoA dehydrogenase
VNLAYSPEHEKFREEVRAFLREHWPERDPEAPLPSREKVTAFRREAVLHGYVYRHVPRRYGGSEQPADPIRADIIRAEFFAAGAPLGIPGGGPGMLVPTLLECGTDEQRQEFIEATLHGRIRWCQGYSEPGSGSDLASLSSRAELDGDHWVIHGHKIWTSSAHVADWMFGLFRTEPGEERHAGISYLLIPMHQPGIEVRPLKQITGAADFNEVFLDGARTHVRYTVGRRGEGWKVSRTTLKHERNMLGDPHGVQNSFAELVELARRTREDGTRPIDDAGIRRRLAELEGFVLAQKYTGYRQLSAQARGDERSVQLPTLMNKLYTSELGKKLAELAHELLDSEASLAQPDLEAYGRRFPRSPNRGDARGWTLAYLSSHAAAIAAGSSNIQRNIIGERGLGLPRDLRRPGKP